MKKFLEWKYWKYVVAFLVPVIFILLTHQSLDGDSWYVLAEGRYIVENGLYYVDPLSMHEGLDVVVQNYGFATIFYLVFSIFGAPGLFVMMLLLNFLVCFLIYKICMLISNKNVNVSLIIMMITDFVLSLGFTTTRAQMVSYVILLLLIYLLEIYVRKGKKKQLLWIPILSLLQINLHASVWWMLFCVMAAYVVDGLKSPKLHLQGYKIKPIITCGLMTFLVGFINPYGYRMMTFIFSSYGNGVMEELIVELDGFRAFGSYLEVTVYLAMVVVLLACIYRKRNIKMRYLLMFFGFLCLGLNTVKGLSQFILVMFFPLAMLYKDFDPRKILDSKLARNALVFWSAVVSLVVFATIASIVVPLVDDVQDPSLAEAVDLIESRIEEDGLDKNAVKIYVGFNGGGYLEYRGFRPYIDPRAEVFLEKNNHKFDILQEWADVRDGRIDRGEFFDKYEFDYLLKWGNLDPIYDMDDSKYTVLYKDEDRQVEVYKKVHKKDI